jgi:catechol 2,3-dioxygenase-like lactoylglutathione lyase family enzyme
MIKDLHHVGIIVKDMEKALTFYVGVLGGKLLYRAGAEPKDVEKEIDVPGARSRLAVLKYGKATIELVEYIEPKIEPGLLSAAAIGTQHLAFEVDDVDAEVAKLKKNGVRFNAPPKLIEDGENKGWVWTYFRDPDGAWLELVENRNLKVAL